MTATILQGVMTTKGRETLAKSFANLAGFPFTRGRYFKIGMGGWINTPQGRIPKNPQDCVGYLDIEADGTPGNIFVQKNLVALDVTFIAPSICQLRCQLGPTEGNDDGNGDAPRFFEIGVFDDNGNMLVYATFPEQTKAANKLLSNYVQIYF